MTTTIYTVGHSNKKGEEFVALVAEADLQTIVDVRTSPYSRYNPQFNQRALQLSLEAAEIRYDYRGKNLGGLAGNVDFDKTIDELVERAKGGERLAVMCSEGKHTSCHRGDTLAEAFLRRGVDVGHLQWTGEVITVSPENRAGTSSRATFAPATLF